MATNEEIMAKHKDVDPFLLKKWERIFNAFFDRNASAEVDWGDFYLVVRQVRDIYGADSAQMKYARSSMKSLWDGLISIADKDKNSLITLDEWITLLKKSADAKGDPKWFNEYLTFMFKLFDVSADDLLDLAEYIDGMRTYGFSQDEAVQAFAHFAVDTHGKPLQGIDFFTFKKYWMDYFHSKNPESRGNWIFGPIVFKEKE